MKKLVTYVDELAMNIKSVVMVCTNLAKVKTSSLAIGYMPTPPPGPSRNHSGFDASRNTNVVAYMPRRPQKEEGDDDLKDTGTSPKKTGGCRHDWSRKIGS